MNKTLSFQPCSWVIDYRVLIPVASGVVLLSILGSVIVMKCASSVKKNRGKYEVKMAMKRMRVEGELNNRSENARRTTTAASRGSSVRTSGQKKRSPKLRHDRSVHHSMRTRYEDRRNVLREQHEDDEASIETGLLNDFEPREYDARVACPYSYVINHGRFCNGFTIHDEEAESESAPVGGKFNNSNVENISSRQISDCYLTFGGVRRKPAALQPSTELTDMCMNGAGHHLVTNPIKNRVSFDLVSKNGGGELQGLHQQTVGLPACLSPNCWCGMRVRTSMVSSMSSKRTGEIEEFILLQQDCMKLHAKKSHENTDLPTVRQPIEDTCENMYTPAFPPVPLPRTPPRPVPRRSKAGVVKGRPSLSSTNRVNPRRGRESLLKSSQRGPPSTNREEYQLLKEHPAERSRYRSYTSLKLSDQTVPKTVKGNQESYQRRNIYVKHTKATL